MKKDIPVHITPCQSENIGCLEATNVSKRCYNIMFSFAANQFVDSDQIVVYRDDIIVFVRTAEYTLVRSCTNSKRFKLRVRIQIITKKQHYTYLFVANLSRCSPQKIVRNWQTSRLACAWWVAACQRTRASRARETLLRQWAGGLLLMVLPRGLLCCRRARPLTEAARFVIYVVDWKLQSNTQVLSTLEICHFLEMLLLTPHVL